VEDTRVHGVLFYDAAASRCMEQRLLGEEPLAIEVQGRPYSVVMRTPGEEIAHVAGFCLGEGIVDGRQDFAGIGYCEDADANVVIVNLTEARRKKVAPLLERRGFVSQTSCGICGKEMVTELCQSLEPLTDRSRFTVGQAERCLGEIAGHQVLRKQTKASHGVALFDGQRNLLVVAEDVGRHNALDKAIGKLLLARQLDRVRMAVLSSRVSYELVQKAARARLPILVSVSRPTALAVELAGQLNMTIACAGENSGLYVYCAGQRLVQD